MVGYTYFHPVRGERVRQTALVIATSMDMEHLDSHRSFIKL